MAQTIPVFEAPMEIVKPTIKGDLTITECNCYAYVKAHIPSLPMSKDLVSNTAFRPGVVAIFDYPLSSKVPSGKPHYVITTTRFDENGYWVDDSNFGGCGIRTHYVRFDDPHFKGFFAP